MRRWIAVAGEAPAHMERRRFPGQRHVANRPMTLGAADALGNVDAVVEIDVIGQGVDCGPTQRLALGQALAHRCEDFGIGPDLRVASHAGMGRRDARILRDLHRGMAVPAIEAEAADVVLMAEWYWLRRDVSLLAVVAITGTTQMNIDRNTNRPAVPSKAMFMNKLALGPKIATRCSATALKREQPSLVPEHSGICPVRSCARRLSERRY